MAERVRLPGITKEAFVSDADRWALDGLRNVPLLPTVVRKFHEIGFDRWAYLENMSHAVRCGPRQYPTLHRILQDCCQILDMPEPELYVTGNPIPNAFAGSVERPYITLRSGIVDLLPDEGLYYLMGHELGHIKAEHVLYFSVARVIAPLLELLGRRTLGLSDVASYGLLLALYEWSRQAEFSADRAGALCSQDPDAVLDSVLAMAGGGGRMRREASREVFLEQARAYVDADPLDSVGKALVFLMQGVTRTHPMPVHRARELDRWMSAGGLATVLSGAYPRSEAA